MIGIVAELFGLKNEDRLKTRRRPSGHEYAIFL